MVRVFDVELLGRDEDSSFGDAPQNAPPKPREAPPRAEKAEKGRAEKKGGGLENRGEEGGASSNEESVSFDSKDVYSEGESS